MTADTAQARFDHRYITSSEIAAMLQVSRLEIMKARKVGKLPGAISVNGGKLYMWERDQVDPYLQEWHLRRYARPYAGVTA